MKNTVFLILLMFTSTFNYAQEKCEKEAWQKKVIEELGATLVDCNQKDYFFLDFSTILFKNPNDYIGFIGDNKKRLHMIFDSVEKNEKDEKKYIVSGTSIVGQNKRKFSGFITIKDLCSFKEFSYGVDDWMKGKVANQGVVFAQYSFLEDPKYDSTGKFEGVLIFRWYITKKNELKYDDIEDDFDSYSNNQYLGSWTSYKTKKSSQCAWGHYRIPCSGDLDWGASEFSPHEKYYKYGWADYKFPE